MPDGGPGKQFRLPQAPRFDRYGLHDERCECARCDQGWGPTPDDRYRAQLAWERMEARKKREAERAAKAAEPTKTQARLAADEAATRELIERLKVPVARPATEEELAELRAQFPLLSRRKDPRR